MSSFDWYVVQAHSQREPFVRERIVDLGREVFLPMLRQRAGGPRGSAAVKPLFPGYLFARLSEEEGDFPRVRWCHGVRRVLGSGARPRPVDDAVVRCIRARTDRGGRLRLGRRLRRGQRVHVVDGPLAGLIGILERPPRSPEHRVAVLLDLFHRSTRVELPVCAVWGET